MAAFAVVLLAFIVRESFVLTAWCPNPLKGDAGEYMAYALNLPDYFGRGDVPDAYRSPGYPLLLWLSGTAIYQVQVLLGTLTVAGVIALARQWMPLGWALFAGLWMALQPHHIASTGTLLSECLFGALLVWSLLCASYAFQRRSMRLALLSGAVFGLAYLTNPVIAFLPFLIVPFFWRAGLAKHGAAMGLVVLLAIGGWGVRNAATEAQGDTRAQINLVAGSWPEYHIAWKWQRQLMHDKYARIVSEVEAAKQGDYSAPIARVSADPVHYAGWYLSKPFLLWDWDIQIGQGGVYTVLFNDSPLDRGWLLVTSALQNGLNPLAFALAFCGLVLALRGGPQAFVAVAVIYLTAVHVVLQAEPRYSVPYRSLEILMAVSAIAALCRVMPRLPRARLEGGILQVAAALDDRRTGV